MISVRADEFHMCLTGRKVAIEYRNLQVLQSLGILEEEERALPEQLGEGVPRASQNP